MRTTWATPRRASRSKTRRGVIVEGNGQGSQVISGNLVGVEINGCNFDAKPDRRQFHRCRRGGNRRSRQLGRRSLDRGGSRQHCRRDHVDGGQRDLRQRVGYPARWGDGDRQRRRGEYHWHGLDRHYRSGQRDQRRHLQHQCVEQHGRRHGRQPGQHDRVQRGRRGSRRVGDRRFDSVEQRLFQWTERDLADRIGQ